MGQTRSGRSARLSPKMLAISAHTIFKLEQTAGAALNDALLRQIVDNLRRHPERWLRPPEAGPPRWTGFLPYLGRELSSVAQHRDELAAFHSITSSASESKLSEIVTPSDLAVLRLMTNSNFVDWTIGRSAVFAPFRIRPT